MRILLLLATTLSASDFTNDYVIEFDKELDHEGKWGYDFRLKIFIAVILRKLNMEVIFLKSISHRKY